MKKSKLYFFPLVLVFLFNISSCLSISPREYENLPKDIHTFPLVEEGHFVYNEKDFKKMNNKNAVLITGKSSRQKFNLKDEIFTSGVEKRLWNCSIESENDNFSVEVKFDVNLKDDDDKKYQIEPVLFKNSYIEIPDRIDTNSIQIPYMLAKIYNENGTCYKIFIVERSKFGPENPKHIIFDSKQESSIFLENNLVATFSRDKYKIYSQEKSEELKIYAAVMNGIFKGVQKYDKGLYLF